MALQRDVRCAILCMGSPQKPGIHLGIQANLKIEVATVLPIMCTESVMVTNGTYFYNVTYSFRDFYFTQGYLDLECKLSVV